MTRKDYVAIAALIKEHVGPFMEPSPDWRVAKEFEKFAHDLCGVLKADNRNFSADRFLTACGFDPTEGY